MPAPPLIAAIEHDAEAIFADLRTKAAAGWSALIGQLHAGFSRMESDQVSNLMTLANIVATDLPNGNIVDMETAVLNLAQKARITFVADGLSTLIQAAIAIAKATLPVPPAVPTPQLSAVTAAVTHS